MWRVFVSLGSRAVKSGPVSPIVNAIRKKSVKPWGIVASAAIALVVLSSCIGQTPDFRLSSLTITPQEIAPGESTQVKVNVANIGSGKGTYRASLKVNGVVVETTDITLAAQEEQTISFRITEDAPGICNVELDGLRGTLKVSKPAQFRVVSLTTTPRELTVGESVSNTVVIENIGETDGTYHAVLMVNGEAKATRDIPVAAGEKKTVGFRGSNHPPGTYKVEMGGLTSTFEVRKALDFKVTYLTITPQEIFAGGSATITATVENTGTALGDYHARLMVNGEVADTKTIPFYKLVVGAKVPVSFLITKDVPGVYEIKVGEMVGTLKVMEPVKPAEFRVISLEVNPGTVKAGEEATVKIDLKNDGDAKGTYPLSLVMDGKVIQTKNVTLAGGATIPVLFTISKDSPGTYNIEVGGLKDVLKVIEIVRPSTGTFVMGNPDGRPAYSFLTVENGLDLDAVVVLSKKIQPDTPILAVYVQSRDTYKISIVGSGLFMVYYTCGRDWDDSSKEFTTDKKYKRFDDTFDFTKYDYKITLHTVAGGTAHTEYLDEEEFPDLK